MRRVISAGSRLGAGMIAMALCGCLVHLVPRDPVTRTPRKGGEPVVVREALTGTGRIAPDGQFVFTLSSDRACRQERFVEVRTVATRREFTRAGRIVMFSLIPATIAGAALLISGRSGTEVTTFDENEPCGEQLKTSKEPNVTRIAVGAGLLGASYLTLSTQLIGRFSSLSVATTPGGDPKIVRDGFDEIQCPPGLLGNLVLVAPWGSRRVAATVGTEVSFPVDWDSLGVDPSSNDARALVVGPWKVSSATHGALASITLAEPDIARAIESVRKSQARTIIGKTPANLETSGLAVDGGTLIAGGAAWVRLTIENRGGSTAKDVVVTSRSSLAQLHKLEFRFDTIQPQRKATISKQVTLPADVSGESITVVLDVSSSTGARTELTQQLKLTAGLCPGGRLTRKQYNDKRAGLQRLVDAGSMTKDDFNRYDAELVRCLE